ncbi:hypothetical protein D1610_15785 [Sphingomonas gilva]|uniref:Uncharacterized protein n=1 Tax=Sphingomonas gilva TaxID=2305907 RepID=A0A396RQI5_9SPHN|nr:hypothetical protein D1610_15785 [Sphingomonas gilva]
MRSRPRPDRDGAGQRHFAQRSVEQSDDPVAFGADHRGDDTDRGESGHDEDERADDGNHANLPNQSGHRPAAIHSLWISSAFRPVALYVLYMFHMSSLEIQSPTL